MFLLIRKFVANMTIRLIVKILYLSLFAGSLTGCVHALGKSKSEDLVGLLTDSKSKSGVTEEQAAYLEKYLHLRQHLLLMSLALLGKPERFMQLTAIVWCIRV